MEKLTDDLEAAAWDYLNRIDEMGGAVVAIETGFMQREIEQAAYATARAIEDSKKIVVGQNNFSGEEPLEPSKYPNQPQVDLSAAELQSEQLKQLRKHRDGPAVQDALENLRETARTSGNLLYPMKNALFRLATIGEVSEVLREEFGTYHPTTF